MRIRSIILTFTIAAVLLAHAAPGRAQTASPVLSDKDLKRIEKVKRDLADIGVGNTITVSRLDNRDFFGRVKTIGTDDFEIVDSDTKVVHIFRFIDIKNVRSGDGTRGYIGGQRKNPRSKWYIFAATIGAIAVISVVAAKSLK